eukprot:TRINITY_DN647_c0_g1_i1.p1 TRINITY_DN647_c0_g1~~TRINITY_DN647_c0_g1_i1.p1  ORF type:complete len:392 (-),score=65.83 TRINITY_DN647_c0_g1_i1:405-1580(-)
MEAAAETQQQVAGSLIEAHNTFGIGLWQDLRGAAGDAAGHNVFISPFSIALALSMAAAGASTEPPSGRGTSVREDMRVVLRHQQLGAEEDVLALCGALLSELNQATDVELIVGNSAWTSAVVKPEYVEAVSNAFRAEVRPLQSAQEINEWCATKTKGMIKKILDDLPPACVMVLVNAIYFKGIWKHKFEKNLTKDMDFTNSLGEQKKVAMMMQQRKNFLYSESAGPFQLVRLPYGESERFCSYVFLPNHGTTVDTLVSTFSLANWNSWRTSVRSEEGTLRMPRIKLEYGVRSLKAELSGQGMGEAFRQNSDSFARIAPGTWIDDVLHKAVVELDEEGTKAAAVTAVVIRARCAVVAPRHRFEMTVDRSFVFVIADSQNGHILFIGTIENPQ